MSNIKLLENKLNALSAMSAYTTSKDDKKMNSIG